MNLVTGASGLLGSHILKQLVERGEKPRAVARSVPRRSYLATLPAEKVDFRPVDLLSVDRGILDGVDTVINCAGLASPFAADFDKMRAINVVATQNFFSLAAEAGVSTWIQISSVATLCDGKDGASKSEADIGRGRSTAYANTKQEADAWLESQNSSVRLLTLHPCYMLDAWDARPSSGSILFALKMGRLPEYVNVVKNFVAARDVASAVLSGLDHKARGHFVIGGVNVRLQDFFAIVREELALDAPAHPLPVERDSLQALTDPLAIEFCQGSEINFDKAIRELRYSPTFDLRQMVRGALAYFQEHRMLRTPSARART